jgi:hypothetical protein
MYATVWSSAPCAKPIICAPPGEVAFDEERRDATVALARIDRCEHDEQARLDAVGDPELAAVEDEAVRRFGGMRGERERITA